MFNSIQEGLEIYKEKLRAHIQEIRRVNDRVVEDRLRKNPNYGQSDWSEEDLKAFHERAQQLNDMTMVLGLSDEEKRTYWEEALKQIKTSG